MPNYVFETAEQSDYDRILKFLADHFYHEEPSIRATKVGIEEWLPIFAEMTEASLRNPFSTIVTNELGDTVVGVLLNSVWSREEDEKKKKETGKAADHDISGFSETMQRFLTVLQKCHDEFWSLAPPDINTVIYREISSVGAPWQRQGIASKMLSRNMKSAKAMGIDGVVSATTSHANQTLLAKNGFKCLKEFPYSKIVSDDGAQLVETDDGSEGMRINFKIIEDFE
ncbi:hypothetical protein GCK72_004634 [Caenorhabditis remanei]|uniref:aralkylamine N-acetyltransferase n=1 Tax=Caenorhabditis remanei TaxID=31234 RepID=A0A6A5HBR0_CAERE|nr:hypothetical protein GCK72_004634 [Caenorhabditis remanei]KAF1764685.1 hypothetical protein GCK72_004634 [Caenorhabditis remanei]